MINEAGKQKEIRFVKFLIFFTLDQIVRTWYEIENELIIKESVANESFVH